MLEFMDINCSNKFVFLYPDMMSPRQLYTMEQHGQPGTTPGQLATSVGRG